MDSLKKWIGIAVFFIFAAYAYKVHFAKISNLYRQRKIEVKRVEEGAISRTLDGNNCEELARYEAHFVKVAGTVKRVGREKVKLGCLEIRLHIKGKGTFEPGERVCVKGFIKEDRGLFYIDVWDESAISLCEGP